MSNFLWRKKKKVNKKKKLCRPTVPNFFGDVSGNKEHFTPNVDLDLHDHKTIFKEIQEASQQNYILKISVMLMDRIINM